MHIITPHTYIIHREKGNISLGAWVGCARWRAGERACGCAPEKVERHRRGDLGLLEMDRDLGRERGRRGIRLLPEVRCWRMGCPGCRRREAVRGCGSGD